MEKKCTTSALIWLMAASAAIGQTAPFMATWSFEGTDNGTSSNSLVVASSVSYTGVNKFGPNPYTSGYAGNSVNIQNWSTALCNQTEYVQFSVQPQGTATVTLTTMTFAFSRSSNGPQQLSIRSSVDGFSSEIFSQATATTYQTASISLTDARFSNQAVPITFRIYACNPVSGGGTLHLDEIQLNGASLPVTLLAFTAKPEGDRVQLAWTTTSEHDVDRFVVERSDDQQKYVTIGEIAATGNTFDRQEYGLTDFDPQPGTNYYRLKQISLYGKVYSVNALVPAVIDSGESVAAIYPNPANPDRIHLRLWNTDDVHIRLFTLTSQTVDGRLALQAGQADWIPDQPLLPGLYLLQVQTKGQKQMLKVLVR